MPQNSNFENSSVRYNSETRSIQISYGGEWYDLDSLTELGALIPKMTSNTAPSGTAEISAHSSSNFPAYLAFDRNTTTYTRCVSMVPDGIYISYTFAQPVTMKRIKTLGWCCRVGGDDYPNIAFKRAIDLSSDGTSFQRVYADEDFVETYNETEFEYVLPEAMIVKAIRFVSVTTKESTWDYGITEAQCYAW
jgi:hypothetical protein